MSKLLTNEQLSLKLDQARWWLMSNDATVFYGSLAMGLKDKITPNMPMPTAGVDGVNIHWDPQFLSDLTDAEVRGVLVHEVNHVARGHLCRGPLNDPTLDHDIANQAMDHEINLEIKNIKEMALPAGGCCDEQFKDMAWEEIYPLLQKQQKGKSGTRYIDVCGGLRQPEAGKQGAESLKDVWERQIIQAAQAQKAVGRGNIPGSMDALLQKQLRTHIDWKKETADFLHNALASRNDWSRVSRRMAGQQVIYPRKQMDQVGMIIAFRDMSGSTSDDMASEYTGIVQACCDELGCAAIIADFDTKIHAEYKLNGGDQIPLRRPCCGGTDFACATARINQLIEAGERIAGVVILTDLDGSNEPTNIDLPLLWVCSTENVAKAGRTVRIEL